MFIHSHMLLLQCNLHFLHQDTWSMFFPLEFGQTHACFRQWSKKKVIYMTSKARPKKKSYNSAWLSLFPSLSLSLLESSHHVVRKLKPNREVTCGFSCRQPQPASSQHLHPLPEMWESAIHIIPVPNLQVFQLRPQTLWNRNKLHLLYAVWISEPQKPWMTKKLLLFSKGIKF